MVLTERPRPNDDVKHCYRPARIISRENKHCIFSQRAAEKTWNGFSSEVIKSTAINFVQEPIG